MFKLKKIKQLKSFRIFSDFIWDEKNCYSFNKINIIYGFNATGKSTFCDFFKLIEQKIPLPKETTANIIFTVNENDELSIDQDSLGYFTNKFKVYHQDYIKDSISFVDNSNYIFSVTENNHINLSIINELIEKQSIFEKEIEKYNNNLSENEKIFFNAKSKIAFDINKILNTNYDEDDLYNNYKALKEINFLKEEDLIKYKKFLNEEKKTEIEKIIIDFINSNIKKEVKDILSETPINKKSFVIEDNFVFKNWVEEGLTIHKDKNICLFCGKEISIKRIDELISYFNHSYKCLLKKSNDMIKKIEEKICMLSLLKINLPKPNMFYVELREDYNKILKYILEFCDKYILYFEKLIILLEEKRDDLSKTNTSFEIDKLKPSVSFNLKIFEEVNNLIEKHNFISRNFDEIILNSKKNIESHILSENLPIIKEIEYNIANVKNLIFATQLDIFNIKNEIDLLKAKIKMPLLPIDIINKTIKEIIGKDELMMFEDNSGYIIKRNNKTSINLSDSEKSIIALIYFFNSLNYLSVEKEKIIVFLDDPIKNLDSLYYLNVVEYIKRQIKNLNQVFIFTYNFSLVNDLSSIKQSEVNSYFLKYENNNPMLSNEMKYNELYRSEYIYLFQEIYNYVKNTPENQKNSIIYLYMGRRFLEGYFNFKLPYNASLNKKIDELDNANHSDYTTSLKIIIDDNLSLNYLTNSNMPHRFSISENILPLLNDLLNFIKFHDKEHFNHLIKDIKIENDIIQV